MMSGSAFDSAGDADTRTTIRPLVRAFLCMFAGLANASPEQAAAASATLKRYREAQSAAKKTGANSP